RTLHRLELAVEAEASDAAQPVARRVEEPLVEERLRAVELLRRAGTEPGVDLEKGFLVRLGRVLAERVHEARVVELLDHLDVLDVLARRDDLDRAVQQLLP